MPCVRGGDNYRPAVITISAMRDGQGVRIKTVIHNPSDEDMSQRGSPGIKLSRL
jgi:hypothetical protein